ncbi:MAG TPA: NAD-binding protein [Leptospiraceae bacterium]|nr:NAD-binding protein [Leptospiraceae bacterium]HMW07693.1 NAD-binding protein [Leptospiraceae bacterium]HMX34102.1 NAD-binding protein [Leptospiraceae bacterium]HMY33293.1 NAD-binding protein [Leptospiraceae bacterium]HMZ63030.1 NAD-binding protein [Leptospiraceae bacterium]
MNKKVGIKERIKYEFENTLSKGTIAIIGWLAFGSLLIVILAGIVLTFGQISQNPEEKLNFFEAFWQSLMHALDAGALGADQGWSFRMVMLLVTIGGIFILSSLIGVLTSGLEAKLEELRKGRSRVLEKNHTLILGWSGKIYPIISEIIIANASLKKASIVILADKDKVEMEDELNSKIPDRKTTKIICRTGSPMDVNDLEVVSLDDAKSIIVMSPDDENPDISVIKTILAITNNPHRKQGKYHIVAEMKHQENLAAGALVGGDEATFVLSPDLIARVTAQTCRQSGLSVVYTELLDFDGVEIYFKEEATLKGKTFKEILFSYETSAVIGIMRSSGEVLINPPMDTVFAEKDSIIVIAEDDDAIDLAEKSNYDIKSNLFQSPKPEGLKQERTLILGWNEKGYRIINELENYVGNGSEVTIVSELSETEEEVKELELKKQKVTVKQANITDRNVLDSLEVSTYSHIIILCYTNKIDIQEADAKTLICLLHLRDIANKTGKNLSIVSEMLDNKNRALAEVTKADDYIVSDRIISLMLSQLSEKKELKKVFDILFEAEGSEVYLKPVTDYVKTGDPMNFYTILESAAEKNQIAIGYRIHANANDSEKAYGVLINPKKSDLIRFNAEDKIVVLAED